MSIFYSLSLEEKISSLSIKIKEKYLYRVSTSKNHMGENILNIDFSDFGLRVLITPSSRKILYDDLIWNTQSNIIFELESSFENISIRKQQLVEILLKIMTLAKGNAIFSFNGEQLLLYKYQQRLIINTFGEFWSEHLKKMLPADHFTINKTQEIDYFSTNNIITQISPPYKTHLGGSFTKEEWEAYESEEYKKYIDKRNKKTSSLFVEENPPQDFALETNGLKEIKHFVMNSRSEQVPVYQYPSTMVAPIAFLPNGTVVEVLKKGNDSWCEVLSKDGKKGFIQNNFVKEN